MLNKISWSEFVWVLAFLLIPYYLFVLTYYFKKEILAFVRNPVLRRGPVSESVAQLKSYPHLQGSDLQEDIANHIRIEVKDKCGFEPTGDDLRRLWHA